jgi:hypothetical protein
MKTIKNDYCMRFFTGNDSVRPILMKINQQNDFVYATNAKILAKIPANLCVHEYDSDDKYPNVENVISQHKSIEKKTVKVDSIFHELIKIECCFKPKMVDCNNCCGTGTKTCEHCDSDHDCKQCLGEGIVPGKELELSGENNCTLFNKKYDLKYIDIIIRTAIFTDVNEIEISNSETAGSLFYVGDFTILLMPEMDFD